MRLLIGALLLVAACSTADASPPSGGRVFKPSPDFTGGQVLRFDGPRIALRTYREDRLIEVQVELGHVRSVWKETEVRLSALEIGAVVYRARDGSRRITRIWSS